MNVGHGKNERISVRVSAWDSFGAMGVWLWQYKGDEIYVAKFDNGPMLTLYPAGKAYEAINPAPTFAIPYEMAADFRKAMMGALRDWGVEVESESKIAGKLEGVEAHLADMRKIVFDHLDDAVPANPLASPLINPPTHPMGCVYVQTGLWTRAKGCDMEHNLTHIPE